MADKMITKIQKEMLKEMQGQEFYTNALGDKFGERVCILVKGQGYYCKGKYYKMPASKIKPLFNSSFTSVMGYEPGSPQMMRELEIEFGSKAGQVVKRVNKRRKLR